MKTIVVLCLVCISFGDADGQMWDRQLLGVGVPSDLTFFDNENGIVIIDKGLGRCDVYRTTDGGETWELRGNVINLSRAREQQLSAVHPGVYFSLGSHASKSVDSGLTWSHDWIPSEVLAGRMLSSSFGYLLLGAGGKNVAIRVTRDSGHSWIEWSGVDGSSSVAALNGFIVDSLEAWNIRLNSTNSFLQVTTDAGASWEVALPIDTAVPETLRFYSIRSSNDNRRVFALGGVVNKTDFVYSDDKGRTWITRSQHQGRVYRIAQPELGFIVAAIGTPRKGFFFHDLAVLSHQGVYADTLAFSFDDGQSWTIDSITFRQDTIIEMAWPNPNRGFVLTLNNGQTYVSRYTRLGAVDYQVGFSKRYLPVYPNPASTSISFLAFGSGQTKVRLMDVLGRVVQSEVHDLTRDQNVRIELQPSVPKGVLILVVESPTTRQHSYLIRN